MCCHYHFDFTMNRTKIMLPSNLTLHVSKKIWDNKKKFTTTKWNGDMKIERIYYRGTLKIPITSNKTFVSSIVYEK